MKQSFERSNLFPPVESRWFGRLRQALNNTDKRSKIHRLKPLDSGISPNQSYQVLFSTNQHQGCHQIPHLFPPSTQISYVTYRRVKAPPNCIETYNILFPFHTWSIYIIQKSIGDVCLNGITCMHRYTPPKRQRLAFG